MAKIYRACYLNKIESVSLRNVLMIADLSTTRI